MIRAVAEKEAELIEGIHKGHSGRCVITIKQANGLIREIPWSEEDGATPILIEAMILNLEIENLKLREATREYCLDFLKGWTALFENPEEAYTIPISDYYTRAEAFIAGFEAASVAQ